ncbi:serine-threonine rich protein [Grosmannia clavigera kw1407]|uniref:Serine-threonine rich protein n=1 Tax=Grosmannia clavigera (strain kw1407 / UAMH 11150) TaxID=655863 RepID=F0XTQ6_GROCL|nr:serine-threonine rich protein [Grosmannia clavigera kw1407]EFW98513.1 serine-threonine rich protein [Grosmannia clavigera kw1407]
MKYTAALSLALVPVVLGKAIRNVYPVRSELQKPDSHIQRSKGASSDSSSSKGSSSGALAGAGSEAGLLVEAGLLLGSGKDIIIIWANGGGSATTSTINQVQTVTQTVTAGAAATDSTKTKTKGSAAAATTVASAAMTTHSVTVGGPKGLVYEPDSITANVGDMVVFTFLSQNHTVTQSSFAKPCVSLVGGMDSGFQPNINNSVTPAPQVAMQVMVSTPLWFYCAQVKHCGLGMVFSINPTANKTQAIFQEMAIAQNGTGTGSAITGGSTTSSAAVAGSTSSAVAAGGAAAGGASGAAAAGSAAAGGASGAAAAGSAAAGGAAAPSDAATAAATATIASVATAAGSAATGVVTGVGSTNSDGSCSCVVQCAAGSFPAAQAQGLGGFGGFAGGMPSVAALR